MYNKDAILGIFSATASDQGCQKLHSRVSLSVDWRIAKEWIYFFEIKKIDSWCGELENLYVPNEIQSGEYSKDGGLDDSLHSFFVANVNLNSDGRLNVNVNKFDNDNVWNAENRNRIVAPKLIIFSCLFGGSFLFHKSFFPSTDISSNFLKSL